MLEPSLIILIFLVFLLAGTVKGVIGLGLPTVSLALLTVAMDLTSAMALMLIPSFVTNLWQAFVGGQGRALLRRFWIFFLLAGGTVWIGAEALSKVDLVLLSALLGGVLCAYALLALTGMRLTIPRRREGPFGALLGLVNGVLTGMTGSFVVPGVLYLQAAGLSRDQLVQAMGILFTVSTLALAVALQGQALLSQKLGILSLLGLVPAICGMVLGQKLRSYLSEARFRKVFFLSLLVLGIYIAVRSLLASV